VRIRSYFSKPKGIGEQKKFGKRWSRLMKHTPTGRWETENELVFSTLILFLTLKFRLHHCNKSTSTLVVAKRQMWQDGTSELEFPTACQGGAP